MFCGGVGVWLYDDALGLRVAHAPRLAPPSSDCMRDLPVVIDEASCAAAVSSIAVREAGLSTFDHRVLCAALEDARTTCAQPGRRGGCTYNDLRAAITRRTMRGCSRDAATRVSTTVFVVTAAPHADIVAELGGASGWRRAAAGNASLEWRWAEPSQAFCTATKTSKPVRHDVFVMRSAMPAGATDNSFALGVPLSRIAAVAASCTGLASTAVLHVTATFLAASSVAPVAVTYDIITRGVNITGLKEVTLSGSQPSSGSVFKFSSANLVSRSAVTAFASTGLLDTGAPQANLDTLLLQSTLPGFYEVTVALG